MNRFRLWLIIMLLTPLSCTSIRDVTHDPAYNLGYKTGELYILKSKVFIVKADRADALMTPRFVGIDFNTYSKNRKAWPDIIGVIDVGTILKISKLVNQNTFETKYLWVFAEILNGKFAGREVQINWISKKSDVIPPFHELPMMDIYDPEFLEPVDTKNSKQSSRGNSRVRSSFLTDSPAVN